MTSHKENGVGPWLIMAGFIRPHVDWSAPQRFWDLYPEARCGTDTVAKHKTAPPTAPKIAWVDGGYVDKKTADLPKGYTSCARQMHCTEHSFRSPVLCVSLAADSYQFSPTEPVNDTLAAHWRRGYYAAVSYMDWNVGKLLDAINALGFSNDTVVAIMADHGDQLNAFSPPRHTNLACC